MHKLLFIHMILHSSTCFEPNCSSSGGHIVYMQHMVPSLCKEVSGGVLLKHDLLVITVYKY